MARNDVEPVVTEKDRGRTEETHPAYAAIGASRVSIGGRGLALYGSDFQHQHAVAISIKPSVQVRNLNMDWHHPSLQDYIRVVLSEAQWASFVSSMNVGEGVPCTLERLGADSIPGIARTVDRRAQFKAEASGKLEVVQTALRDLEVQIGELSLARKTKDTLLAVVAKARQELDANLPFVADQFDEHVERTTERAKAEVNAYVAGMVQRAGLAALAGNVPVLQLTDGEGGGGGHEPE